MRSEKNIRLRARRKPSTVMRGSSPPRRRAQPCAAKPSGRSRGFQIALVTLGYPLSLYPLHLALHEVVRKAGVALVRGNTRVAQDLLKCSERTVSLKIAAREGVTRLVRVEALNSGQFSHRSRKSP